MKHCKVLCRDETQHGEDYYLASQADSIIERLTEVAATTDLILKAVNETVERLTAERDALNDTVVRLTADAGIFTLDEQTILASDRNAIRLLALWNQIQADKTGIASYEDRAEYLSGIFPQKRRAKDD